MYTGVFYDDIREPYTFFDGIRQLKDIDMEVVIAGSILYKYVEAARDKDLGNKIIFLGYRPFEEAIALQKGADILLLVSNNSPYQIPGKIFEYFGARRPILAIKFIENDPAISLIEEYNRGFVVPNNAEEIARVIKRIYELWRNRELEKQFSFESLEEFSWDNRAMQLENVINTVTKASK